MGALPTARFCTVICKVLLPLSERPSLKVSHSVLWREAQTGSWLVILKSTLCCTDTCPQQRHITGQQTRGKKRCCIQVAHQRGDQFPSLVLQQPLS